MTKLTKMAQWLVARAREVLSRRDLLKTMLLLVFILFCSGRSVSRVLDGRVHTDIIYLIVPALHETPYTPVSTYNNTVLPYGLLWYAIAYPLSWIVLPSLTGPQSFAVFLYVLNIPFSFFLARKNWVAGVYHTFFSNFTILGFGFTPQNVIVSWFIVLSLVHPVFLFLAIIAKLPVGAPLDVFLYWTSVDNKSIPQWKTYAILMAFWLMVLGVIIYRRKGGESWNWHEGIRNSIRWLITKAKRVVLRSPPASRAQTPITEFSVSSQAIDCGFSHAREEVDVIP